MQNAEIIDNIAKTASIFFDKGKIVEIRIINTKKGTISGYFDVNKFGLNLMLNEVKKYVNEYSIYFTLNPPKNELLQRSQNVLSPYAKSTTKDAEIAVIRWLHVDLDPVRVTNSSSTNEELEIARKKSSAIMKFLKTKYDFPEPVLSCSGNGINLDYKLNDLPNTVENKQLLKNVLKTLDILFSDNKIKVDVTTHNPSRIIKLFGCKTFKGENTRDRPHRYSKIETVPDKIQTVNLSSLQRLAKISLSGDEKVKGKKIDVEAFLKKHNIDVFKKKEQENSTIYVLNDCPWSDEHKNKSAYIIKFKNGHVIAGCHHDSCSEKNFKELQKTVGDSSASAEDMLDGDEENVTKEIDKVMMSHIKEFFTDQDGESYVLISFEDVNRIYKTASAEFEILVGYIFNFYTDKIIGSTIKKSIADHYSAKAIYSQNVKYICKRVNKLDDTIFYHLGGSEIVQINKAKVTVVDDMPTLFLPSRTALKQVTPDLETDESLLKLIKKHFRITKKDERLLFAVYLITCFISGISHPVLTLHGEKGSSKTVSMKMIRQIVDPVKNPVAALPIKKDDIVSTISNSYMTCFDNLQKINVETSDIFCIVSTGGVVPKRRLYTDNEEISIELQRCLVLNGISVVMTMPDLLDRSILIELERIPKHERKTEKAVLDGFNEDLPKIIGLCFKTLSKAMALFGTKKVENLPRMADFAEWGYYIALALGKQGEDFIVAYENNQIITNEFAVTSNPLADAIVRFMDEVKEDQWKGTATQLFKELNNVAEKEKIDTKDRSYPKSSSILSRRIKEIKANLEATGIAYSIEPTSNNKNLVVLEKI